MSEAVLARLTGGWTARGLALAAGLAAGLAHPPFGLLPGLLGYAVMMRLGETEGPRRLRSAFFRGWLAGLGYFAVSVWWVVEAFLVDAAAHGWMAPFALVLMAGGLALFWGLALLLYRLTGPRGAARVLVFAGALAALEWARGHVLTGFPWNLPGETWRAGSAPSQAVALVGVYALTWVTVAIAAAPAVLLDSRPRRARLAAAGLALAGLAGLYAHGLARLADPPPRPQGVTVRIVQANIDQKEKWKPENLPLIFEDYLRLGARPAAARPDVIIWPEGALPAVIDELLAPGSLYAARLNDALAPGQTLMMGANRVSIGQDGRPDYFNSLIALRRVEGGMMVTGVYDKHRLVPFGEFLPLGELMTRLGIRSLAHMPEDFSAGPEPGPIAPDGLPPLQPLICYEALFPRLTAAGEARSGLRPSWILNVSNDAWFGATSGPLQHLNLASYRAIEEGRPVVRSTPTGVSAVIDSYGRILPGAQLGLGVAGVIDAQLPGAAPPTPYRRWGEAFFAALMGLSMLTVALARVR